MTNREWLMSLSDKDLAEYLCSDEFQNMKLQYTHSAHGIESWLGQIHIKGLSEVKPASDLFDQVLDGTSIADKFINKVVGGIMQGSYNQFKGKVYLAGGWFSPAQESAIDKIETLLSSEFVDVLDVYSPRTSNKFNEIKGPRTTEDRMQCFKDDIAAIDDCDFMICSAVEYDSGTIFEMGYAYAKGIPIIYYNDNPVDHKRVRNLMLVGACDNYYAKCIEDLRYILQTGSRTTHGDDSEAELGRLQNNESSKSN